VKGLFCLNSIYSLLKFSKKYHVNREAIMKHTINLWSFIFSFICVGLLILYFENESINTAMNWSSTDPIIFLLILTAWTFIGGLIGMNTPTTSKTTIRSIITITLTLFLLLYLISIVCFKYL
ncbi:hypothetical protein, partial [Bacillus wiedmannii]|uniref:hypothetical protein n=2 Tax=Bacillus wiedmannii TaxID=1890302 RepID=UPI00211D6E63